jgi:hypothetical protein
MKITNSQIQESQYDSSMEKMKKKKTMLRNNKIKLLKIGEKREHDKKRKRRTCFIQGIKGYQKILVKTIQMKTHCNKIFKIPKKKNDCQQNCMLSENIFQKQTCKKICILGWRFSSVIKSLPSKHKALQGQSSTLQETKKKIFTMRNAEGFSQARSTIYQVELWIYTPQ